MMTDLSGVTARPVPRPDTREDVFNEVIYGLGVLKGALTPTHSRDTLQGVGIALEYVKAMVEAEA
jgi:hypothetical protein